MIKKATKKKTVKRTQFNDKMYVYGKKTNLNFIRKEAKKNKVSQSAVLDQIITEYRKNVSTKTTVK